MNPSLPVDPAAPPIAEVLKKGPAKPLASPLLILENTNRGLTATLTKLYEAIAPGAVETLNETDYLHLATNHRVTATRVASDFERLVRAVTGGPLNAKLALEMAEEARREVKSSGADIADEYTQRMAALLTGLESQNFAFMDDPATDERVRNCPTCKAARAVVENMNAAVREENAAKRELAILAEQAQRDRDEAAALREQVSASQGLAGLVVMLRGQLGHRVPDNVPLPTPGPGDLNLLADSISAERDAFAKRIDELTRQLDEATKADGGEKAPAGKKGGKA